MPRAPWANMWLLLRSAFLAMLWSASPMSADAEPSVDLCSNRVLVSYVYTVMLSQGVYEYRTYVRNRTRYTLAWTMSLGSFPEGVSLLLEHPIRGTLAPYAGETLRIGRGSVAAISLDTVEVLYDRMGEARPFVSLHTCTAKPR